MQSSAVWLVLVLSLLGANLPFVTNRLFGLLPLRAGKPWYTRFGELFVLYFVVGGAGLATEAHLGQIYPQHWEFYAVSAAMFLVFAFPGFVGRYLMRR